MGHVTITTSPIVIVSHGCCSCETVSQASKPTSSGPTLPAMESPSRDVPCETEDWSQTNTDMFQPIAYRLHRVAPITSLR